MIRHRVLRVCALLLPFLVAACGSSRSGASDVAPTPALAALEGQWDGEYVAEDTAIGGRVSFRLTASGDSATGNARVVPRGATQPLDPATPSGQPGSLRITFVRLESGEVQGTLEPFRDPDGGAAVSTTLVGAIDGDNLSGTFTSTSPDAAAPMTGRWSVMRRSP
ncbi:MAG TPA: hypothetical protein VFY16_11485 [Gemmatimonadaceae bacterium]|nr:hypothetical protein [Gemmatimonadaceae bacterium]